MQSPPQFPHLLQFENLSRFENLFHFSTTRGGGVSKGEYQSFNLGIYAGDDLEEVEQNRQILANNLGISLEDLYFPYQTHEDKICVIDQHFMELSDLERFQRMYGVDAMITNQKNSCIGVSTADCVPILLYDPSHQVLAAVHAGWRGTVEQIVVKTLRTMCRIFSTDPRALIAGIAPSISQAHFEVGEEVAQAFWDIGFERERIAKTNSETGKTHLDLWEANRLLMIGAGILPQNIEVSGLCTFADEERFFSARRQTIHSGRMITGGMLR